jgi:hypothetical protein
MKKTKYFYHVLLLTLLSLLDLKALAMATPPHVVPLPASDRCVFVAFKHPTSSKWPLQLYLCHHSKAEFNKLRAMPALDNNWMPAKRDYQGLANMFLDSRLPSMALAQGRSWFRLLSEEDSAHNRLPYIQLTDLTSPYFGCLLEVTEEGFIDPCLGARWDKLGRLLAPVSDLPDQSLRQFPFVVSDNQLILGQLDNTNDWTLYSFVPDLHDQSVPLLVRIGQGLFWGMLDEVNALWPELMAQGPLSNNQQSHLFIMATSKEQVAAVRWLAAQGLNPMATNDQGDNALTVARMIKSDIMQKLLTELSAQHSPHP